MQQGGFLLFIGQIYYAMTAQKIVIQLLVHP